MSRYTSGLAAEDAEKALKKLRSNPAVANRIVEIAKKDQESSVRVMRASDSFDSACWSEKQAFELGKQAYAQTVIDMLNQALKEKD